MILLVCGSRQWWDVDTARSALRFELDAFLHDPTVDHPRGVFEVVHGAARGADTIIDQVMRELQIEFAPLVEIVVTPVDADWDRYPDAAGPIRNRQMLREHRPDRGLALMRMDLPCTGTKDMRDLMLKAGIPVTVVPGFAPQEPNLFGGIQ